MPDSYFIVTVKPEWVSGPEEMGSKTKFWYSNPEKQDTNWLFKHPKPNTGEHWAEKISEQVAHIFQITHAKVELAEFQDAHDLKRGSASESFTRGERDLCHGNEVLRWIVPGYDPEKKVPPVRAHFRKYFSGNGLNFCFSRNCTVG